jgi:hypothetical protein
MLKHAWHCASTSCDHHLCSAATKNLVQRMRLHFELGTCWTADCAVCGLCREVAGPADERTEPIGETEFRERMRAQLTTEQIRAKLSAHLRTCRVDGCATCQRVRERTAQRRRAPEAPASPSAGDGAYPLLCVPIDDEHAQQLPSAKEGCEALASCAPANENADAPMLVVRRNKRALVDDDLAVGRGDGGAPAAPPPLSHALKESA